jgi:tetratricopeptide (TPR) repeat protein
VVNGWWYVVTSLRFVFGLLVIAGALQTPVPALAQALSVDAVKLAEAGARALDERRFADALASFTAAAKVAPRNAEIAFGVGVSAYMLGQNAEAERQLVRALQLNPRITDASIILGELQYRSGRISDAVATYETALKSAPSDARLKEKIAAWSAEAKTESRFAETRGVHFRVLFEGPVDQALARRAVDVLEAAYLKIGDALGFYPSDSVEVVLYTSQQFRDITRGPAWASGVYDGRIRVPVKGALEQVSDLERVLTHEYVHAIVANLAGRGVPAWVNEGLAVVLEPGGLASAERVIAAARSRPPLRQLHTGFSGLPDTQAQLAYAESAVAARAMLDVRGPSAVLMLLRDLGAGAQFAAAFHQRIGVRYEEFEDTVARR